MRSERRPQPRGLLALAALALALGACSAGKSFVVLHLKTDAADVTFKDIEQIVVSVSQTSALTNTLTYDARGLTIDFTSDKDLSISFSAEQSGVVTLDVVAIGANNCRVARANTTAIIRKGGTASATAFFYGDNGCPTSDGGVPSPDGATFPGCNPASPACSAGNTCQVNCTANQRVAACTPAGKGTQGTACTTNEQCAPGSQCFRYASPGCAVSVCLRFCSDEAPCAPAATDGGDPGTGTVSSCAGPVQCDTVLTSYRTCTFACDPRESARAANTSRCPAGLACLVVGDRDQVDCACPEASRTGTDGADCTGGAQCAPGYICNLMSGAKKCRALCRCDASQGFCTAPNDCRAAGKACNVLTNDTLFGVCL